MRSFGSRGYEATSLDALAAELGVRKQTILYYFPSKEALLEAVIDACAADLTAELEHTPGPGGQGMGPGRGVGAQGFPPGRSPPRAARVPQGGQPPRPARLDPPHRRARPVGAPGGAVPRGRDGRGDVLQARPVDRPPHRLLDGAWGWPPRWRSSAPSAASRRCGRWCAADGPSRRSSGAPLPQTRRTDASLATLSASRTAEGQR